MPRFFDVLLGRTKPVQADLDALFGLVGAQITLQASESLVPSGQAGVCYKPVAGRSFAETAAETSELLGLDGGTSGDGAGTAGTAVAPLPASGPRVHQEDDKFGFHWVVLTNPDFQELVNHVHLVNSTLQEHGYGPQLLCSVVAFRPDAQAPAQAAPSLAYLVYLYKRGAFYPFIPVRDSQERRDVESELRLQTVLADDVKIEADKERWMPLWGLPVR